MSKRICRWEYWLAADGQFSWHCVAANGNVLADGRGHNTSRTVKASVKALWRASGALPAAFPVLNYVEAP